MKKLKLALPILFLAVSNIAYGEGICPKRDLTCQRHWAVVDEIRPVRHSEFDKYRKIRNSFGTQSSRFSDLEERFLSWNMKLFGKEFKLVLTDEPGKIALQLRRSFN